MPALSTLSVLNVANPFTAATVLVPDSVPAFGFVPRAMVMLLVALVTRFPPASWTSIWMAGLITAPPDVFAGCTKNASFVAPTIAMLNGVDVAIGSPPPEAVRVYPFPSLSILTLGKVATPLTAAMGPPPDRTPPVGLVPMAREMLVVAVVTRFPPASRTSTWTAGAMATPPAVLVGCTRNARLAAGPTATLKAADVAAVRPVVFAVRVYPVPALSIVSVLKLATPPTAATLTVPPRVPLFGLVPTARVTLFVAAVTRFPPASRISTCTAGLIVAPPVVLAGCTRNPSFAAAPTVILNALDVAPVSPVAAAASV